jgi:Response regulator containing CheY-like receiver domain and AraC-type DNA-binding domain
VNKDCREAGMFTLMIVEDEEEIREGIKVYLEREVEDMEFISAKNGSVALNLLEIRKIDAMLLDIKMPVMDGVTLLQELKKRNINVVTVVLTGHDEFEYARTALEYGAVKYLLKPITPDGAVSIANELKRLLADREQKRLDLEFLREQVKQSFGILKERFLNEIISSNISYGSFETKARYFGLNSEKRYYQVCLIDLPEYETVNDVIEYEVLVQGVRNTLEDALTNNSDCHYFNISSNRLALLYCLMEHPFNDCIPESLPIIKSLVESTAGYDITMGIGRVYEGLDGIKKSYGEAVISLRYRVIAGSGSIINHWSINSNTNTEAMEFDPEEFKLNLKLGDGSKIKDQVIENFDKLASNPGTYRIDNLYAYSNLVTASIASVLMESGKSLREILPDSLNPFSEIYRLKTLDAVKAWFNRMIDGCISYLEELGAGKSKKIVEMAMRIIEDHYPENITTRYLSERLYLNPDYIGRIFKNDTGLSVSDYLNKIRINHARELLKDSTLMVYEVALKVGFNDQHYFSTVFKKLTGTSPSQFKDA